MDKIDYTALSRSRYTDQFKDDPVFDALVQTLIEYKSNVQNLYADFALKILDIDKSTGKNLDLIGSIIGQSRNLVDYYAKPYFGFEGNPRAEPYDKGLWYSLFNNDGGDSRVLTDEEYRRVLKARIIRNRTNCTREDFVQILSLLIGGTNFVLSVPKHGNITLRLPSGFSNDFVLYFLSRTDEADSLIPKPLGYRMNVIIGDK